MPVFATDLAKCDLVFSTESGAEIAVNTLWMQHQHYTGNTFDWGDALQTIADHVVSSLVAHGTTINGTLSSTDYLQRVDAYQIGTDGKATDKRTHVCAPTDYPGTQSGSNQLPPFLAAVVQLWGMVPGTYDAHPRRRRGRIFWPLRNDAYLGSNGLLKPANQDLIRDDWAAVLNDLQGMHVGTPSPPGNSSDFMRMGVVSRVTGAFSQLEAVSVSGKPGVQRRRMNKLHVTPESTATINH